MPTGTARNNVFNLHGHFWQEEPYTNNSKVIGNNPLSEFKGSLYGIGPSSHYEVIPVNGAGGARRVTGDYLYRTQVSLHVRWRNLGHLPCNAVNRLLVRKLGRRLSGVQPRKRLHSLCFM